MLSGDLSVVEWLLIVVQRVVVLLRGTVASNGITVDEAGNAILSVRVVIPTGAVVRLRDWRNRASRVCGYARTSGGSAPVRLGEPCPLECSPPPPPCRAAKCPECKRAVDFVSGWSLCRSWPPEGDVCPDCFGPPSNGDVREGAHLRSIPLQSNEGNVPRPSGPYGCCKKVKRAREASSPVPPVGLAADARELAAPTSDANQFPPVVVNPGDSPIRGRHYRKNHHGRQRLRELRRMARALGIVPGVGPAGTMPQTTVPVDAGAPMAQDPSPGIGPACSPEEGQLLKDDGSDEETMRQLRSFGLGGYDSIGEDMI